MNGLVDTLGDDFAAAVHHLLHSLPNRSTSNNPKSTTSSTTTTIPTDIFESDKDYIFYLDVPGLSKSDVQVTIEEERTLVVKNNGKRKREDGEEEGCKYVRLERRGKENLVRKFRLPEDADVDGIVARCENGILKVVVGKKAPAVKGKTVEVRIA